MIDKQLNHTTCGPGAHGKNGLGQCKCNLAHEAKDAARLRANFARKTRQSRFYPQERLRAAPFAKDAKHAHPETRLGKLIMLLLVPCKLAMWPCTCTSNPSPKQRKTTLRKTSVFYIEKKKKKCDRSEPGDEKIYPPGL